MPRFLLTLVVAGLVAGAMTLPSHAAVLLSPLGGQVAPCVESLHCTPGPIPPTATATNTPAPATATAQPTSTPTQTPQPTATPAYPTPCTSALHCR